MKAGDIVFTKKVQTHPFSLKRGSHIDFKGHAFVMMLGHVSPGSPIPDFKAIQLILGTEIGLINLDDIQEFLGEEAMKTCVAKYMQKYGVRRDVPTQDELSQEIKNIEESGGAILSMDNLNKTMKDEEKLNER